MKILLTGGCGFIASHIADAYREAGHEVVVVDNLYSGRRHNLDRRIRFYKLSIAGPQLREVFERERPEVVNHQAAQTSVRRSLTDPSTDAQMNIIGSMRLLELCREFGVRKVIYASSGGAIYGEPRYLPVDESHPVAPLSPYGASKYAVELYLGIYRANYGLDYTVLRYANVYGPRQDPYGEAGVVAIFSRQMLQGQPVTINGSGEQERDFVYVSDVATANLLALARGSGGAYNIGSGVGTSVNTIFSELKDCIGEVQPPVHGPAITGEVFRIYLSAQKAERDLGWKCTTSLTEGLRQTVDYFRAEVGGK